MARNRRLVAAAAAGAVALAGALGLSIWLSSDGGGGAPGTTIGPTGIQALPSQPHVTRGRGARPSPVEVTVRQPTPPLSTGAPRGSGLGAPDHLTGSTSLTQVSLHWRPVSGAAGYVIYRDGAQAGETTGLTFDDTGLRPGVSHVWMVAAFDRHRTPGDRSTPLTLKPGS